MKNREYKSRRNKLAKAIGKDGVAIIATADLSTRTNDTDYPFRSDSDFCKSMTFRWFLDVEPEKDGVVIKIQKSRKDPIQIIQIKKDQQISEFTELFKTAYENIH